MDAVKRARQWLLGATLLLGLVCLTVWGSGQLKYRRGSAFMVAVAPGRAILVEVWPVAVLAERWSPYDWYYSFREHDTNARWVGFWYEDTAARSRKQLGSFTLPTWPLLSGTAAMCLALAGLNGWHRARLRP